MHINGILLSLLFSSSVCLSPFPESYTIRLTRQIQERECGVIPKIKHRKDFNGLVSQFGQSPWQASIFDSRDETFFCSGTLISSRHVVTSAACLLAINSPSSLEVRLGDWDISSQDSPYETYDHFSTSVNKVIISPDFSMVVSQSQRASVAVLKLESEVDYVSYPHIAPICLPPPLPQHHNHKSKRQFYDQCIATGWGAENYLISTGRKKEDPVTISEPNLENQLKPEEVTYLKPVILAKPPTFSVEKSIRAKDNERQDSKYEPTILVPNLFESIINSKEIVGLGGNGEIQSTANSAAVNLNSGPWNVNALKNIDPVEEYMDLPEYIDSDAEFSDTDEDISVEATTHRRVSLSNMPKGEESMEVMESQRQQVYVPYNYSPNFQPITEKMREEEMEESIKVEQLASEHESRLYRHKQKYKQGRLASRHRRINEKHEEELKSEPEGHLIEKRAADIRFLRRRQPVSQDMNVNLQMNMSTVLKSVQVVFRKNCRHMRSNIPEIVSISNYNKDRIGSRHTGSKSCIKPIKEDEIPNFCMLDIGSPVVCTSVHETAEAVSDVYRRRRHRRDTKNIFKTIHHISRHVFPTKIKVHDGQKIKVVEKKKYTATDTQMHLTGVITWKDSCSPEGESNFNFRDTQVTSVQEILPFLLESMQK